MMDVPTACRAGLRARLETRRATESQYEICLSTPAILPPLLCESINEPEWALFEFQSERGFPA